MIGKSEAYYPMVLMRGGLKGLLVAFICFSFVLSEVIIAHQLMTDLPLELVDMSGEGEESSEGEGKEDKSEKKSKDKLTNNIGLFTSAFDLLMLRHGYALANYQPDDFQEIPQPPPEV